MRNISTACYSLTCALFTIASACAQDLKPSVAGLRNLFGAMEESVTFGSTELIMCHPGILLDPSIDPDSKTQFGKCLAFYDLLDCIPKREPLWAPSGRQVSQVYEFMLENREYPPFKLKPEEKKILDDAKQFLFEADGFTKKGIYAQFESAQTAFVDAIVAENSLTEDAPSRPSLVLKRSQAQQRYKDALNQVARTLYDFNYWSNIDGSAWWENQNQRFRDAVQVIGQAQQVPVANLYPSYKTLLNSNIGWTRIKLSAKDIYKKTTDREWTRRYGGSGGFWFARSSYERNRSGETHSTDETRKVAELEFEVTRAQIYRPWLNSVTFSHRGWRIRNDVRIPDIWKYEGNLQIADGEGRGGKEATALMPMIQTGLLVARRVKLTFENAAEATSALKTFDSVDASASGGFWCFSAKGHYNSTDKYGETQNKIKQNGSSLEISDPQIIGFYVWTLPRCPNPAPGLFQSEKGQVGEIVAKSIDPAHASQKPEMGKP